MPDNPLRRIPTIERRSFLRYGLLGGVGAGLAGFTVGSLGFLYPNLEGGFGSVITLPAPASEILAEIQSSRAPFEYPAGRMLVIAWDASIPGAKEQYGDNHAVVEGSQGLQALYQYCVHLGCKVPWCQTSQWFECPCHGSKYNRWGEWVDGPAPRGLDRFPSSVTEDGLFQVNTGDLLTGPARTANVLQQQPEGPHCVDL